MKILLLALAFLNLSACSMLKPELLVTMAQNRGMASDEQPANTRLEWVLDPTNKVQIAQFYADEKECKDFAFKSKIMGSRYYETDIMLGCLKRKGYTTRYVANN